ncbi:heme ABC transporter ATP-binding protein [Pseudooceanicola sp. CBS1P-1]|uniref:Heme ABC transporter ATP-binding protein n=1 Tax=Pseudooceanicola albus TaxID=2692189 RepID=A0A6L7G445_9RHOB|nr:MULTISPECIES: heme ABC transporter ATP-binding protein [Pseudooceanicola]MBT9383548.1 heme ABC transporter ATP-binding protein [Pseudooceanicola endophyticus]MXN17403.1 heme ABC transporter ATP-binding protein [Pseudooceanicola albus]
MLSAKSLNLRYGQRRVLHDVDFTARPGEVTAIVGPNGSGKTSLLSALSGARAYDGEIRLNGLDLRDLAPARQAQLRAVLPQSAEVAFPFTLLELVRLGLSAGLARAHPGDPTTLVRAAIARVGLAGHEGRMVQQLSGGERQRAQLARVLVQIWEPVLEGAPRWLLLDEPVSALDIGHQLSIMQLAHDYARAGGGVVAVMHDLNLTSMYADRVVLLQAGRLRAAGRPEEVLTDHDLSACYGCALRTNTAPPGARPWLLPQSAAT